MSNKIDDNKPENELENETPETEATEEKEAQVQDDAPAYTQNIPEDEIWTYQIEGLQPPHINKNFDNALPKKIVTIVILIVAISLSIFFSVRAVHTVKYDYDFGTDENGEEYIELVKYSNPGQERVVTIDKVDGELDAEHAGMPITRIHEYAFNCDGDVRTINIGPSVKEIDGKTFYSCWALESINVDENNEYFCDIDGVLFTKDMTEIICYPPAHNVFLANKYIGQMNFPADLTYNFDTFSWGASALNWAIRNGDDFSVFDNTTDGNVLGLKKYCGVTDYREFIDAYNMYVGTYVVPSTVTKIGKLAFAYSDINTVYFPEGLKSIETLAFFKCGELEHLYSYTCDIPVETTNFGVESAKMSKVYLSLPEGLEKIGSDAFSYDGLINYIFIPASVTEIGHHAFWDTVKKENDNLIGIGVMNVAADHDTFKANSVGEDWKPKFKNGLFKKAVDVNYSAEREAIPVR